MFWFNKLSPQGRCFISFLTELFIYLFSMGFKWDHQQFLMRIYWNFMESGISDIEIWLKFWVSGSNELGKIWEEGNVVPFVKMSRNGIKFRKRVSRIWRRLSSIYSNLLLPPLSNDRFLIDLLTGRDYLSAFDKRFSRGPTLRSPDNRAGSAL